jgi:LysM repeat protein
MKLFVAGVFVVMVAVSSHQAAAQTFPRSSDSGTNTQLQALSKKIDEQNTKIDLLSQQILKLEQQLTNSRPGVMIGEATPAVPAAGPAGASEPAPRPGAANTHTVARGETLTSIAKMHNVTLGDLQKANHIENDRKLQIGQTIIIPTPSPSPASE